MPEDTPPAEEFLKDLFIDMVHYVERYHATNGEPPNDETMMKRFGVNPEVIEEFKVDPLAMKSLRLRGINYPPASDYLNERQLAAIAVMTNYVDKRSDEKKLRDIGITTREWATWQLEKHFSEYLLQRSERMFQGAQHEAHLGLIKGLRTGNVASVKLYNEMTGRYNPEAENNFNIRVLMGGIIEILQTEIQDPISLHRIATKMMNLATREQAGISAGQSGRYAPSTIVVPQKEIEMSGEL